MANWLQFLVGDHGSTGDDLIGTNRQSEFLPDFCSGSMVGNIVILAEFFALVVTILSQPLSANIFNDLLMISIFVQWIALTSVAVLCWLRPYLNRLAPSRALLMSYLLLLCVTLVVSELMIWVMFWSGMIASSRPEWYIYYYAQNLTVSAVINALALRYFVARHQLRLKTLAAAEARMELIKYRIRPHFLFNSMNIIASLTQRAPVRAEAAIEDMADLFRLMLDENKELVPVQSEIAVAKKYIKLEKLRLGKRLNVNWKLGTVPRSAKTPVLMLQLLLENAIHYGIEPLSDGGEISIGIKTDNDVLKISITNPNTIELKDEVAQENSAALENVRFRVKEYYDNLASVNSTNDGGNFTISVEHPAFGDVQ